MTLTVDRVTSSRQHESVCDSAVIIDDQQYSKLIAAMGSELHPIRGRVST
ncbi:MAG TPA: hypothetical protein VH350_16020 [Candidatus Sulfotelmatobacter sp.]|nr:hypothetical protein [Candidatus Sulfotelmatobacter sp.]